MPTKLSSYLTELGFTQINNLGDTNSHNRDSGEFIVVKENNRLYRYESNSTQPVDNLNVLNTSDGGNTRWIAVGGAAMTQSRVQYTFTSTSNEIPLGKRILSKANVLYVNIGNTQVLSSEYTLNDTKDKLILTQAFDAGVQAEVVIVIGDFTPEVNNYEDLDDKPRINNIELVGNKTAADLNLQPAGEYATKEELTTKADITSIPTKISELENDSNYLTTIPEEYITETELTAELTKKQDVLTFDDIPTLDSNNPVKSSGVYSELNDLTMAINEKANKGTTLAEYGITDAYNATEIDTKLATKADKGTTLAEYGIEDTYTKEEINQKFIDEQELPLQQDQGGKFLTTDGNEASWVELPKNYSDLGNKPSINSYILEGNKLGKDYNLQDLDTAVNYNNITNCITKIPQDIKLESSEGMFKLHEGSKVYTPNGNITNISADVTRKSQNNTVIFYSLSQNTLAFANFSIMYSGPASQEPTEGNWVFYNTETNTIYSNDGREFTLPLGYTDNTGELHVFNGFGYIGNNIFALPGVKGLIPNGFNTDGSLNSIEFTTTSVLTNSNIVSANNDDLRLNANTIGVGKLNYDIATNKNYNSDASVIRTVALVGKVSSDSTGRITSLTPNTAFHAVDYNEYAKEIAELKAQISGETDLPDQTGNAGKFLSTDGSVLSWEEVTSQNQIQADWNQIDDTRVDFIKNKPTKLSQFTNDTNFVNTAQLATKQDILSEIQLNAINSGITLTKVSTYDGYAEQINTRQLTSNLSQVIDNSTSLYPSNKAIVDYSAKRHQVVSVLPAEPDPDTFYYIPEE